MSERASLIKVSSSESPDCFRNSQNTLRNYFNKTVRKDLFLERTGLSEDCYDEDENYLDFTEHLYAEDNHIVMTRIPRDQVEFAVKAWRSVDEGTPIIRDERSGFAYTSERCIEFFEHCLKETDATTAYDSRIYLIWE